MRLLYKWQSIWRNLGTTIVFPNLFYKCLLNQLNAYYVPPTNSIIKMKNKLICCSYVPNKRRIFILIHSNFIILKKFFIEIKCIEQKSPPPPEVTDFSTPVQQERLVEKFMLTHRERCQINTEDFRVLMHWIAY